MKRRLADSRSRKLLACDRIGRYKSNDQFRNSGYLSIVLHYRLRSRLLVLVTLCTSFMLILGPPVDMLSASEAVDFDRSIPS